jgi:phosphopentomutase
MMWGKKDSTDASDQHWVDDSTAIDQYQKILDEKTKYGWSRTNPWETEPYGNRDRDLLELRMYLQKIMERLDSIEAAMIEDHMLRKEHPALDDLYQQYLAMKKLVK